MVHLKHAIRVKLLINPITLKVFCRVYCGRYAYLSIKVIRHSYHQLIC